mgnify:CR=1 FL=1
MRKMLMGVVIMSGIMINNAGAETISKANNTLSQKANNTLSQKATTSTNVKESTKEIIQDRSGQFYSPLTVLSDGVASKVSTSGAGSKASIFYLFVVDANGQVTINSMLHTPPNPNLKLTEEQMKETLDNILKSYNVSKFGLSNIKPFELVGENIKTTIEGAIAGQGYYSITTSYNNQQTIEMQNAAGKTLATFEIDNSSNKVVSVKVNGVEVDKKVNLKDIVSKASEIKPPIKKDNLKQSELE